MLDNNKLTSKLNETGFPFQEWCFSIVKKVNKNNRVTKEFPFTLNFPNLGMVERGQIDIMSLLLHTDADNIANFWKKPTTIFIIECKKADPSIKNWCFIKTNRQGVEPKTSFLVASYGNGGRRMNTKAVDNSKIGFGINSDKSIDINDTVLYGYETNDLVNTINRNQTQKVYNSLLQVNQGSFSIEDEECLNIKELELSSKNVETHLKDKPILFLPILVTNANLLVADFDPVLVSGGEIKDEHIKWADKNWVLYDFGLPSYLQHGLSDMNSRGIFIVNYEFFEEFYQSITPKILQYDELFFYT